RSCARLKPQPSSKNLKPFLLERQSGATPTLENTFDEVYAVILSILRHLRIDAIRPSLNSAGQVMHLAESGLTQEIHRFRAAHARAAVSHDLAAGVEFMNTLRKITQRNQMSANVAYLIFVRLADVQDKDVFSRIQPPL